jgi:hypothetical protein
LAVQQYAWSRAATALDNFYREILGNRPGKRDPSRDGPAVPELPTSFQVADAK